MAFSVVLQEQVARREAEITDKKLMEAIDSAVWDRARGHLDFPKQQRIRLLMHGMLVYPAVCSDVCSERHAA